MNRSLHYVSPGKSAVLIIAAFLLPLFSSAKKETTYHFESVSFLANKDIGLINDAIESKDGFIWLSGTRGLSVFDGKSIITYSNGDPVYPLKKDVSVGNYGSMIPGDNGSRIYLEERNSQGVICFDLLQRKILYEWPQTTSSGMRIRMSAPVSDTSWLQLLTNAKQTVCYLVIRGQKGSNKVILEEPFNNIWLCQLKKVNRNYWFLLRNKIYLFAPDQQRLSKYTLPDNERIQTTFTDSGTIYFTGTISKDIYCWDVSAKRVAFYKKMLPDYNSLLVRFAKRGENIYFGDNKQFYILNTRTDELVDLSRQLTETLHESRARAGSELNQILVLQNGDVLLIFQKSILRLVRGGKARYDDFLQKVQVKCLSPYLSFRGMTEDEQGNLYAAYYTGLLVRHKGDSLFRAYPTPTSVVDAGSGTYTLNHWRNKLLWDNIMIDKVTGKCFSYDKYVSYCRHTAQCLQHDTLWSYTWWSNRLVCHDLKRGRVSGFQLEQVLGLKGEIIEEVSDILVDPVQHHIWLAMKKYGIAEVSKEGKLIRRYSGAQLGIKNESLVAVNVLKWSDNGLWFGDNRGLGLLNPSSGTVQRFSFPVLSNGHLVQNREVYSLLADEHGNFYLGTDNGLLYFDTASKVPYFLAPDHPLGYIEFNRNAAFRAGDGKYYFGSTEGLFAFRPGQLDFRRRAPDPGRSIRIINVAIESMRSHSFRYLGVCLDSSQIRLGYTDLSLNIRCSLPAYRDEVLYSYKLDDPGGQWSDWQPEGSLFLPSLSSGDHLLQIRATSASAPNGALYYTTLFFEKEPVWYKRGKIILMFGILAIALVAGFNWYIINNKRKMAREIARFRTKVSADLHDDIGSLLSGIALQCELLGLTGEEKQQTIRQKVRSASIDAVDKMRDIVWAIDSRKDKYGDLVEHIKITAEQMLQSKGIEYNLRISIENKSTVMSPSVRQNIFLIFKEAVNNIVRHSDATHVSIELLADAARLRMVVADNGSTANDAHSDGQGLSNMKLRARNIGAILRIDSVNGFKVSLLLKKIKK